MGEPIRLKTPLSDRDVEKLRIGDRVLISGVIYWEEMQPTNGSSIS